MKSRRLLPHIATTLVLSWLTLAACRQQSSPPSTGGVEATPALEEKNQEDVARISPASAARVGIGIAQAAAAGIRETLPLYGVVKPNAERVREVIARFPGTVRSVNKVIGDAVKQGETLATIESNESLQTYALTAPIGGIVTAREADPGEQAGTEVLFSIADASSVWVELNLFPTDAARVRSGQDVLIESVSGGLESHGRIGLVGVFGSGANQALTARVQLPNPERRWTPGLFVNGAVELSRREVPVAVAASAVQTLDGRSVVFVPVEGGFAARAVKTGRSDRESVEILEGLEAGADYVARNSFVVKAELGKAALEAEDDDGPPAAKATEPPPEGSTKKKDDDDDAGPPR